MHACMEELRYLVVFYLRGVVNVVDVCKALRETKLDKKIKQKNIHTFMSLGFFEVPLCFHCILILVYQFNARKNCKQEKKNYYFVFPTPTNTIFYIYI
jgi:hypothetical protein